MVVEGWTEAPEPHAAFEVRCHPIQRHVRFEAIFRG
jgi:hypothetical protein